jgi:hypothetical protein
MGKRFVAPPQKGESTQSLGDVAGLESIALTLADRYQATQFFARLTVSKKVRHGRFVLGEISKGQKYLREILWSE